MEASRQALENALLALQQSVDDEIKPRIWQSKKKSKSNKRQKVPASTGLVADEPSASHADTPDSGT